MKMRHAVITGLVGAVLAAAAPGCGWAASVRAVASFSILGDMVARVGGDRVEVSTLVGADSDAHVYEPTPADAKTMAAADVVFINGLGFEGWLDRLVMASGYRGAPVVVTAGIEAEALDQGQADGHAEGRDDGSESLEPAAGRHVALDPHAWQSAVKAQTYIRNVAGGLCAADRAGCDAYTANALAYATELAALDEEIKTAVAKIPAARRTVITSHDAFGYFGRAYGITFIAPEGVSTESEASARDVARLIDQIRADKASALFVETISDPRLVEQIARETGLTVGGRLYSDALSGKDGPAPTYIAMMRHNIRLLSAAMTGS